MKYAAILCLAFALTGCDPTPPEAANTIAPHGENDRFDVTTAQSFYDGSSSHVIAVLRDKKTHKEYLIVTGAGATEMHCTYNVTTQMVDCEEK